jgi:hypothetical protein
VPFVPSTHEKTSFLRLSNADNSKTENPTHSGIPGPSPRPFDMQHPASRMMEPITRPHAPEDKDPQNYSRRPVSYHAAKERRDNRSSPSYLYKEPAIPRYPFPRLPGMLTLRSAEASQRSTHAAFQPPQPQETLDSYPALGALEDYSPESVPPPPSDSFIPYSATGPYFPAPTRRRHRSSSPSFDTSSRGFWDSASSLNENHSIMPSL